MTATKTSRRLAAIVAADVAGYSRLMSRDEDGALSALMDIRAEVVEPLTARHEGRLVKSMGDGFLFEFSSAVEAVGFSIDMQKAVAAREGEIQFRIGVNVGDVIVADEDIFGDGVNVAARLESEAPAGGICISDVVLRQVAGAMSLVVEDLGVRALKNIDTPVRMHVLKGVAPRAATVERDAVLPVPAERPSIAILPFRSLSESADAAFIADGVALGLQSLLVQLSNIFFVNACAHPGYKNGAQSAAEALKEMPVRYAVEGSVRSAGERLRVRAQLADLQTGALVWAETYDRNLSDVFDLEDEMAREIAAALSVQIVGGHMMRDFAGGLTGPRAWESYLRGINHLYRWTRADLDAAIPHFEALSKENPDNAVGANYLSLLHYNAASRGWSADPERSMSEAISWAESARDADAGNNGLAHSVLGSIALSERRHDDSLELCRTAVGYRANCPFAIGQLGLAEMYSGDPASGVKHVREAMSVRMVAPPPLVNALAAAYRDKGELPMARAAAQETMRLEPDLLDGVATLCTIQAMDGDAAARETADRLTRLDGAFSAKAYARALPYRDGDAAKRVAQALKDAGAPD